MNIQQALAALDGRRELFATRPTGKIVSLSNRGKLQQHGRGARPCNFTPMRADLVADDWEIKTVAMMAQEAEAAIAAAASSAE